MFLIRHLYKIYDSINDVYLKKVIPKRIGISAHYGFTGFPINMNLDVFTFKNQNRYINFNASAFFHYYNFGSSLGFQNKSLLSELGLNYTSYTYEKNIISFNPKIGIIYNGVFMKVGPSFMLNKEKTDISLFRIQGRFHFNIEIGYYFRLNSKLFPPIR